MRICSPATRGLLAKRTRSAGLIRRAHGQKAEQGRQLAIAGDDAGAGTVPVKPDGVDQDCSLPSYVLITPARNEEAFIEKTIESVVRQTILPLKWVIANDGSTHKTRQIVGRYLEDHPWIEMVQRPQRKERHFAANVDSFNVGFQRVKDRPYESHRQFGR